MFSRLKYEYESRLPLIPSISIKVGRCLGSIMRARHFSSPSLPFRAREEKEEGGKNSRFCLKKKKKEKEEGKEAKRVKRSLLGASLRSARCRVFFRPLSAWQIVSKTVAGTWATSPPRLRRPRFLKRVSQNLDDLSVPVSY